MTIWHDYRQATGKRRAELEEQIIRDNWKLAHYVANRIKLNHRYEYDDIHALALIGLLAAVRTFDPDYGVKFSPHAIQRMRWEILKQFDADDTEMRKGDKDAVSIFLTVDGTKDVRIIDMAKDDSPDPKKQIEDRMLIHSALMTIREGRFTKREKEIFHLVLSQEEKTMRQIADEQGVSAQMIGGYMKQVAKKVRAAMPEILEEGLL